MLNPLGFIPFVHLQDSTGFQTINISPPHWRWASLGSFKGLHGSFEDQIAPLQCQKKKKEKDIWSS